MIETPRLTIFPLTAEQVRLHVAGNNQLETALGLPPGQRDVTEPLRSILLTFTIPRLADRRLNPLFHTLWVAVDRQTGQIVADAKFKGEPDNGAVEIGYGTYPAFGRQGYMTEIVGGLVRWAGAQPGVRRVEAETAVENVASQKVLEKNGFRLFDRREDMLWWTYDFADPLSFDEYGHVTPYDVVPATLATVERYFAVTAQRRAIWDEFLRFRETLRRKNVPVHSLWIDGSYVTRAEQPNDLDVLVFTTLDFIPTNRPFIDEWKQLTPHLHVFWVPLVDQQTAFAGPINELERFRWFSLFSSDKAGRPKGLLRLTD